MNLPEEPLGTDPENPTRGWKYLRIGMDTLGILLFLSGLVVFLRMLNLALPFLALSQERVELRPLLLVLGWTAFPFLAGLLLRASSAQLARPTAKTRSGTFLIIAAASTFAGLAWIPLTVAWLLPVLERSHP
jgi:hypothetical protein